MAEEQILEAPEQDQEQGPGPGDPVLKPEDQKRLDAIIAKMKANKEPDEYIKTRVNDFTLKYGKAGIESIDVRKNIQQPAVTESTGKPKPEIQAPSGVTRAQKFQADLDAAHQKLNEELNNPENDDVTHKIIQDASNMNAHNAVMDKLAITPRSDATAVNHFQEPTSNVAPEITPEQVAQTKQDILKDNNLSRAFLQKTAQLHPEKSAELQHAMYLADAAASLNGTDIGTNTRVNKMLQNAEAIKKGDASYHIGVGGPVFKHEGFWDSVVSGLHSKNQLFDDYDFFTGKSDDEIIKKLDEDRKNADPDEPVPVPKGVSGEFGQMLGSNPLKATIAGGITAMIPGAEEATPWVSAAVGSSDFAKMGYAGALRNAYYEYLDKDPNHDPHVALAKAKEEAQKEASVDAATGAIMSIAGAKMGMKPLPKFNFTGSFKTAALDLLKQSSHFAAEKTLEGTVAGTAMASAQVVKNKMAQAAGLDRDTNAGVDEQFGSGMLFTMAMAAITKAGKGLNPDTYKTLLKGVAAQPEARVNETLGEMVLRKQITPEQATEAKETITDRKDLDSKLPDNITEDARTKIARAIKRRDKLQDQLETMDKAFHADIKEKIKITNAKIVELSKDKIPTNATTEQSASQVDVRDTSGDGQEMGGREQVAGQTDQVAAGESSEGQTGADKEVLKKSVSPEYLAKKEQKAKAEQLLSRDPESVEEEILHHFIGGNKVSEEQFSRSTGFGGFDKSSLNVDLKGGRRVGMKELFSKRWALDEKGTPIDEFARQLSEKYGGDQSDIENQIVDTLKDNTKKEMIDRLAKMQGETGLPEHEIADSKTIETAYGHLTEEEATQIDRGMMDKIHAHVQSMPEKVQDDLSEVLKKYQDQYGEVDWDKLKEDSNGFDPDLLNLPEDSQKELHKLIHEALPDDTTQTKQSEPDSIRGEDHSSPTTEKDEGASVIEPSESSESVPADLSSRDEFERELRTFVPHSPSIEQKYFEGELSKAKAEYQAAESSFDSNRKELDKGLIADQEDLFGERKSKKADTLFDERASKEARDKAMQPHKERLQKAKDEVQRLQKQVDEHVGKKSAQAELLPKIADLDDPENHVSREQLDIKPGDDTHAVLDKLIAQDGEFTPLLKLIKESKVAGKIKMEVYERGKNELLDSYLDKGSIPWDSFAGFYIPDGTLDGTEFEKLHGTLAITDKSTNAYYDLTHEFMHGMTVDNIGAWSKLMTASDARLMKDIYEYIKAKKPIVRNPDKTIPSEQYGLASFNEFLVESIINPKFREHVGDVTAENKNEFLATARAKQPFDFVQKLREFYNKLVRYVFGKPQYAQDIADKPLIDKAVDIATKLYLKDDKSVLEPITGKSTSIENYPNVLPESGILAMPAKAPTVEDQVRALIRRTAASVPHDDLKAAIQKATGWDDAKVDDLINTTRGEVLREKLTKDAGRLILDGRTDEQIMNYLKRKGLDEPNALAALGEAKANPLNEAQKERSMTAVKKEYFTKEDDWLGNKDLNRVNSQQEARKYQEQIKTSTTKGTDWKDVDRAILIYLDTQRNPEHFKEYYEDLTPEQKKIADLSQNLSPAQKAIADDISEQFKKLGELSLNEGVIKDIVDNYVNRAWDFGEGKQATEANFKFNTSTKHQLQRTLDTILQGYAEGMKLKIEGASNSLQILKQEIGNVIENKRLLDQGLSLKYNTGELNDNGKPIQKTMFTTDPSEPGYKKIDNPFFRKWEYAGKIADHPEQEAQAFGRRKDVLVTEDGVVMKKSDVYAPEDVAKSLNNILGHSKLSDNALIQGITKFNAAVKQSILSYSGFHIIAFTRAHVLSAKLSDLPSVNPITAYRGGLRMLAEQHPVGQLLIRKGMTITRQQDFLEGVNSHNTWLGNQLDKNAWTKAAKDKMIGLNTQFHKYLFETYGAGLKMFDGINLYKSEIAKHPNENPDVVAERVAKLMNDTYGGINWQRMRGSMMQNATTRHLVSLALLAPDWTASNLRFAKKFFERGQEGMLYRKTWARVLLRGALVTGISNAIASVWDDKDDEGNQLSWGEAMARRYGKAWEAGRLRSTMIDITPLYHFIGGDESKRAYFSMFGAYTDPVKMATNPFDFLESKTSFITKLGLEAATGENWQHRQFTTLDELTGLDDKGQYTKDQVAHKKGDISPTTGKPYVRSQTGHKAGDEKGGKLGGEFTKASTQGARPLTYSQLPSFIGSQMRGMMPTAIQNLWQIASGENDATTGLLNAAGSGVLISKDKADKKETTTKPKEEAPIKQLEP